MTGKEAMALSGRGETWLRRHSCAWCEQTLWRALTVGCGAIYDKCDPTTKNFSTDAEIRKAAHAAVAKATEMKGGPLPTTRCDRCDNGVDDQWDFCPFCGEPNLGPQPEEER